MIKSKSIGSYNVKHEKKHKTQKNPDKEMYYGFL